MPASQKFVETFQWKNHFLETEILANEPVTLCCRSISAGRELRGFMTARTRATRLRWRGKF